MVSHLILTATPWWWDTIFTKSRTLERENISCACGPTWALGPTARPLSMLNLGTRGGSVETSPLCITGSQTRVLVGVSTGQSGVTCRCPSAKGSEKTWVGDSIWLLRRLSSQIPQHERGSNTRQQTGKARCEHRSLWGGFTFTDLTVVLPSD